MPTSAAADRAQSARNDHIETEAAEEAPRPARRAGAEWAIVGIFLIVSVAALVFARVLLMPIVLAFLLALVFAPVRRFLERRFLPSWAAAALIVGAITAALLAGLLLLSSSILEWVENAPMIAYEIGQKLESLQAPVEDIVSAGEQVKEITTNGDDPTVQEVAVRQPGFAGVLAATAPSVLAQIVLTLVLLSFLIASGDMFYEKIVHAVPTFSSKRTSMRIAFDIERKLSRYLFTITIINACLGTAIGTAMWLIGMPDPLMFAIVGFLFNYVPYLGAAAGVVLATAVGLVSFDEPLYAAFAGGSYLMLTFVEGQFVTPHFVGRRLKLNTVVVLIFITFWAWAWSVVGMLIAVPLLVALRTFSEHVPQLAPLGDFLSARKAEREPAENDQS